MRILSVHADAFGPLQNQTLELAEGMTVVSGSNESAKSTWHAAILAALCGLRRGSGRSQAERQFESAHRPWRNGPWRVRADLRLDDGRGVRMLRDLAERAASSALDIDLGNDLTGSIIYDGTPDASAWLGMTRNSFAATACISQGHMLRVKDPSAGLRELLQRAAGSESAAEYNAASSLSLIKEFRDRAIGSERGIGDKPLPRARREKAAAEAALQAARQGHQSYIELAERAKEADERCEQAERDLQALRASALRARASAARRRADAACAAQATVEALPREDRQELSRRLEAINEARSAWRAATASPPPKLEGPTATELQAELDKASAAPEGDLEPHAEVDEASQRLTTAAARLDLWIDREPQHGEAEVDVDPDELRELAARLRAPATASHRHLENAAKEADEKLVSERARLRRSALVGIVALGAIALGAMLAAGGQTAPGLAAVALGVAAGVVAARWAMRANTAAAADEAARARLDLRQAVEEAARSAQAGEQARLRCAQLGVAPDADSLLRSADEAGERRQRLEQHRAWVAEAERLKAERSAAEAALRAALELRGAGPEPGQSVLDAMESYVAACRSNRAKAQEAARADALRKALANRWAMEREAARRNAELEAAARKVLSCIGEDRPGGDSAEDGLVERAEAAMSELAAAEAALAARLEDASRREAAQGRLEALLADATLSELAENAATLEAQAAQAAARAGLAASPQHLFEAEGGDEQARHLEQRLAEAEASLASLRKERDRAQGELAGHAAHLEDVAEAEERAARAQASLDAIVELKEVLEITTELLETAEAELHRELAPGLSAATSARLERLSAGRYRKVIIDPRTLDAKVMLADGSARSAEQLSYGTTEQIYLLLRLALVEHLEAGHDTSPFIADDITVHADAQRSAEILSMLHEESQRRQVVLFSQEESVRAWAEASLDPERDALVTLSRVPLEGPDSYEAGVEL